MKMAKLCWKTPAFILKNVALDGWDRRDRRGTDVFTPTRLPHVRLVRLRLVRGGGPTPREEVTRVFGEGPDDESRRGTRENSDLEGREDESGEILARWVADVDGVEEDGVVVIPPDHVVSRTHLEGDGNGVG